MCFVLDGWSQQIKVYPGICNLPSSVGAVNQDKFMINK